MATFRTVLSRTTMKAERIAIASATQRRGSWWSSASSSSTIAILPACTSWSISSSCSRWWSPSPARRGGGDCPHRSCSSSSGWPVRSSRGTTASSSTPRWCSSGCSHRCCTRRRCARRCSTCASRSAPSRWLSVGLVLATTLGAGLVVYWLLPVPLAAALALGAVVAPPDAVAATAIARRAGLPRRALTILEGESLFNDATALVCLKAAVAAIVGSVTVAEVARDFGVSAIGGVAVGVAVARGRPGPQARRRHRHGHGHRVHRAVPGLRRRPRRCTPRACWPWWSRACCSATRPTSSSRRPPASSSAPTGRRSSSCSRTRSSCSSGSRCGPSSTTSRTARSVPAGSRWRRWRCSWPFC